ncbi:MAG: hypothetical protein VB835_11000, partial [Pirellulales bacterium]
FVTTTSGSSSTVSKSVAIRKKDIDSLQEFKACGDRFSWVAVPRLYMLGYLFPARNCFRIGELALNDRKPAPESGGGLVFLLSGQKKSRPNESSGSMSA